MIQWLLIQEAGCTIHFWLGYAFSGFNHGGWQERQRDTGWACAHPDSIWRIWQGNVWKLRKSGCFFHHWDLKRTSRGWGLMHDDKLNLLFQRKWHQYLLRSIGGPWEADTSSTCWELQHHLKAMAVNIVFSAFWEVPKGSHLPRSERYVSSLRSWTMVYWNVTHSLLSFFSFLLSLRILLSFIFFPMKFLDTPRQ